MGVFRIFTKTLHFRRFFCKIREDLCGLRRRTRFFLQNAGTGLPGQPGRIGLLFVCPTPEEKGMSRKMKSLFLGQIEPRCAFCSCGRLSGDGEKILCTRKGIVDPGFSCRHFRYDPLRRTPRRAPALPTYDSGEFKL